MPQPKPKNGPLNIEVALQNREFEIQLFWQRANYFLVLITALGVGVFTVQSHLLGTLLALFGAISCWLWFRTNLGSRFWQVFWESEVSLHAERYELTSFQKTDDQIKHEFQERIEGKTSGIFRKYIDGLIAKKPSVTFHMIMLSFFALVFWCLLALYFLCTFTLELFSNHDFYPFDSASLSSSHRCP